MTVPENDHDEDTGSVEQRLLHHAERQTRALERISRYLGTVLVLWVIATVLWLIAVQYGD